MAQSKLHVAGGSFSRKKMEEVGFMVSELEPSLDIYQCGVEFMIIWLHVGKGFYVASSQQLLMGLKNVMEKSMKIKWSDKPERLVGIDFTKSGNTVELSQEKLAKQIVSDYQQPFFRRHSTLPDEALEINAVKA